MSAYVVNDNTIRAVLGYAEAGDLRAMGVNSLDALGQILIDENRRSVNYRYNETEAADPFVYKPYKVAPIQAAKFIICIDYQSCETPGWDRTRAHALLFRLLQNIVRKLGSYESCAWDAPAALGASA